MKDLLAAEEESSAAAKKITQIAQTQRQKGACVHGKASEIAGLPAVCRTAIFDFIQRLQVEGIVRLHADRPADMLQSRHLIAQTVIGKGRQIIPSGALLLAVI